MKKVWDALKKIFMIVPAMGGILLDGFSKLRIVHFLALIAIYFVFRWLFENANFTTTLLIFISFFITRYVFLFSSFVKNGIADRLKRKYGEEGGFNIYKTLTAVMFFSGGLSFSLIIYKSGIQIPVYSYYSTVFNTAGLILAAAGFIINVWATYLVGVDIYYYKDLFVGRKITEFEYKGPYKIFSNPMYGPGQANGYGTALTYGSAAGITGMLLNQLMMYIFFFTIEKPHIKRTMLKKSISG